LRKGLYFLRGGESVEIRLGVVRVVLVRRERVVPLLELSAGTVVVLASLVSRRPMR
jgi:hypothetical protein